ncbi:MAG: hypothetical protein B0W54_16120 [Cellvibrio sp. 79]|nr:MAG: hypothetical protein B0W54_16120 [Cellvibrio sp. 79]
MFSNLFKNEFDDKKLLFLVIPIWSSSIHVVHLMADTSVNPKKSFSVFGIKLSNTFQLNNFLIFKCEKFISA